jgi:hypothetical protein
LSFEAEKHNKKCSQGKEKRMQNPFALRSLSPPRSVQFWLLFRALLAIQFDVSSKNGG